MTGYESVGVLFHLTIADHIDSCTDSLVQLSDATNTKHIIVQEQSLSTINSEVLFFTVLHAFILQQRQTYRCLCHLSVPSTTTSKTLT
jgi:hypothetical protein